MEAAAPAAGQPAQGSSPEAGPSEPLPWSSLRSLPSPLWSCGGVATSSCGHDADLDLSTPPTSVLPKALRDNLAAVKDIARAYLDELRDQCQQEKRSFDSQGRKAPRDKLNRWAMYLNPDHMRQRHSDILAGLRRNPDCRMKPLPAAQLKSLVILQHALAEDTLDVYLPESQRRHSDTFEGFLTPDGVNSQLIKDAHRSEWTIEGRAFTMQGAGAVPAVPSCDRKQVIKDFQQGLVTYLEKFLLDFCHRQQLSELRSRQVMQAVTTQMSQAGLANLERASRASSIFVGGQGLEQRTAYKVSLSTDESAREELQLSIYCMKTGFNSYHTPETLAAPLQDNEDAGDEGIGGPTFCSPSSYLYQYATVLFSPSAAKPRDGSESGRLTCQVIDLLDEVVLEPVGPL